MVKLSWLVFALVMLVGAYASQTLRILVVFPFPGKSHTILGEGVVRHLIKAGHEVTFITPTINKNVSPNLRQIDVSDNYKVMHPDMLSLKVMMEQQAAMSFKDIFDITLNINNMTFHNENVMKLIRDPKEHFDVVIAEWMFNELYTTFSAIFDAPFIWVSTVQPHFMVLRLIDEPCNPAYTPDSTSSQVPPFSFFERVRQLSFQVFAWGLQKFVADSKVEEIYSDLAPLIKMRGKEVPPFEKLRFNASLMLGNSHVSLGPSPALPQSYKAVGGYHIDTDVKPLPEDLKKLMDNAKHGVIYFSLGSNVKSQSFPTEVKQSLLKMFGSLKQTVIWKFEEVLKELPSNVHILKWAPQPSILAHPNCKLFITHGGLLSITETIFFGKPIVGIPVFADQFVNIDRAVKIGLARKVDLSFTMADKMKEAINEVWGNPSYSNKATELSFIYHHRVASPGAELVHWVEHVALTRGAPHLRSPAIDVPFYQKLYLDLAAITLIALYILKKLINTLFGAKKNSQKKQKKN
uniref:UDP-glucuronosyltransferase n=1 Tax=Chilo suppressalis TaxID=168631 RepID=A0A481XUB3_CHISP|nr:UDP-glycosyltransferase UGT40AP1 [Chilo suppressalis]